MNEPDLFVLDKPPFGDVDAWNGLEIVSGAINKCHLPSFTVISCHFLLVAAPGFRG